MINNSPRSAPAASSATSQHTHGALHLTELHRFTDPAEAAASLALREGNPRRSTSTLITAGFMSATSPPRPRMPSPLGFPTERPDSTRSCSPPPGSWSPNSTAEPAIIVSTTPLPTAEVRLADGNQASVGDVIITRSNDRRLRLTATDWVKNGDRWTITAVGQHGDLTVRHNRSQPHRPAARRLRPHLDRSRLRHHHPRRPRRLRRHHARPVDRAGVPAAAVHDAHPRPARQPPLPPGRRRRRPPHPHPTRHHLTPHADRDAAADPRPR